GVGPLARGGDEDALGSGLEVDRRLLALGELAGALENDVDAHILPRKRRRVRLAEGPNRLPSDLDPAITRLEPLRPGSVHRVVGQEMSERLRVGDVVHRDEIAGDVALERRPDDQSPDAAEPVDCDPHGTLLAEEYPGHLVVLAPDGLERANRLGDRNVDDLRPAHGDHPAEALALDQVDGRDAESGPEDAIERGRRSAALDVPQDAVPRLVPRRLLDLLGERRADPAQPHVAERVALLGLD